MPAKNSVKIYLENGFYHIYNRGVAKNNVFLDDFDYSTFLSYLKNYLSPKDNLGLQAILQSSEAGYKEKYEAAKLLALNNFSDTIELLAYALMPNHFHLLVHQKDQDGIDNFMNSLATRYSCFFNRKYKRVGSVFQGVYKAVSVESEQQLLHLSRYIHRNSPDQKYPSSLPEYLGKRHTSWIKNQDILYYFNKDNPQSAYLDFVNNYSDLEPIVPITIDLNED